MDDYQSDHERWLDDLDRLQKAAEGRLTQDRDVFRQKMRASGFSEEEVEDLLQRAPRLQGRLIRFPKSGDAP
jgi:hypothetical protein